MYNGYEKVCFPVADEGTFRTRVVVLTLGHYVIVAAASVIVAEGPRWGGSGLGKSAG
jgi:hypothetical protein